MHILLLFAIVPFLLLLAGLVLLGLMLAAAAVVEFPWVVLAAAGLGLWVRHSLPSLGKKQDVLCQSM